MFILKQVTQVISLRTADMSVSRYVGVGVCVKVGDLQGKVELAPNFITQNDSSSAPLQSSFPSQAFSSGINLTDLEQK